MNKCEKYKFKHLWVDTTPNTVFATFPLQYPPKQRECLNCGLKQTEKIKQREIREWVDDASTPRKVEI